MDPIFGFMHARIQSWFPFNVQVYVNGREWLAVEMDKAGIQYRRRENCFTWVEDAHAAQQLLDEQLKTNWPHILNRLSRFVNPLQDKLFPPSGLDYYWSVYSSEWATDVTFRNSSSLAEIYPALVHHAITNFSSPDVMRFLGKRIRTDFSGEVVSRFRDRPEGLRIKHALDLNSVKLYDKQGSVLRVETTIQRAGVCAATGQRKATPTALSSGVRSVVASQTCIVVPSSPRTPMSATPTLSPLVIPQPHSVDSSLASAKKLNGMAPPSELFALGTLWTPDSSPLFPVESFICEAFATGNSVPCSFPRLRTTLSKPGG